MIKREKELCDSLFNELFPICRSLSGNGNRITLKRLKQEIPLEIKEISSGTKCFDWEVPPEWNIRDAWIKDKHGNKIVDFTKSNLHVVNYSIPVHKIINYKELKEKIHTLPDFPDHLPYRHSYYDRNWGFCMSYAQYQTLDQDADYEVYIDSELNSEGSLTYADCRIQGNSGIEYILSTYCCHPSLANDNLSGLILSVLLFKRLLECETYHSYRLIIAPETIGIIAYLFKNEEELKKIDGGYVITTVAGPGTFGYKSSFLGSHRVDQAALRSLKDVKHFSYPFCPDGSDERQFSSPGFRIPTGTITKDKYYEYPQYHTSADNLNFTSSENLLATLELYWESLQNLEKNRVYERVEPHCEIQLGKHGLYPTVGGAVKQSIANNDEVKASNTDSLSVDEKIDAMSWLMFASDGEKELLDLEIESGIKLETLFACASEMVKVGVLKETCNKK